MTKLIGILVIAGILLKCDSSQSNRTTFDSFHGVPIHNEIEILNKDGSMSYYFQCLTEKSLDGFWTSYTTTGDKSRTQLYLNGKLDTMWVYGNNEPARIKYSEDRDTIYHVLVDTSILYTAVRSRFKMYSSANAPQFIHVEDRKFIDIPIKRKYLTYDYQGDLDRELLLINDNNLDGFWLSHQSWNSHYDSRIIINNTYDTTLYWGKDRLAFEKVDEDFPDEIMVMIGIDPQDSLKIIKPIQEKMGLKMK